MQQPDLLPRRHLPGTWIFSRPLLSTDGTLGDKLPNQVMIGQNSNGSNSSLRVAAIQTLAAASKYSSEEKKNREDRKDPKESSLFEIL